MENQPIPTPSVTPPATSVTPPPVTVAAPQPQKFAIPTRPKNKFLPVIIGVVIAISVLLLLMALISINRKRVIPPPSEPIITESTPVPTLAPDSQISPIPTQIPVINRLPLTNVSGHRLIAAATDKLWSIDFTKEGPRKTLLSDVKHRVLDMSVSPSRALLAFTFSDSDDGARSGLRVIDLKSSGVTEYIPLLTTNVTHPTWSSDNLYLAVWNSSEQMATLFDMTTKRRLLDVPSTSPLVFLPGSPRISYVQNGTIFESDYDGKRQEELVSGVDGGVQQYSPDRRYMSFHNQLGQLIVLDRGDKSQQVLSEASQSIAFEFTSQGSLIYYDSNSIFTYAPQTKKSQAFFQGNTIPKFPTTITPNLDKQKLLAASDGFYVYSPTGAALINCDYTNFKYNPTDIPLKVWSPDGKFILSSKYSEIADATTCSVSARFDVADFHLAIWVN